MATLRYRGADLGVGRAPADDEGDLPFPVAESAHQRASSGPGPGQGRTQVGTSVALWLLLPLVIGWIRIQRSEIS
ncbi:hypothetical protein [Modestobacter sp. DSM 44400]|uniref:hypothetical protein n=1 Tax=Modestobacter sp. DSM 44400 TaxID=1550230 RepID=UPI001C312215|nr:hypothetical protein [Modestobacter sp. DSM 44400]